jgi:hypothetical protein
VPVDFLGGISEMFFFDEGSHFFMLFLCADKASVSVTTIASGVRRRLDFAGANPANF